MKLLMITGLGSAKSLASDKRGAFYNTLEEFHKHWDRIDIISPKVGGKNLGVKNIFGNVYVHISPWPLIFHPFWFLKKGIEIYREQKFDLMTVHEFPPFYNGIGARLLSRITKVSYILEIFHVPGYPRYANVKELIYRSMVRAFISYDASGARAVRIMNPGVGKFLELSGISKEKLSLIPAIYIDTDVFRPMSIPKEYDLIFIGRLESNKGVDLLLQAVSKLKRQMPNIKCLIVGEGSLKENLSLEISHLSLQNNIIMHGYARDSVEIAQLINKSRVLIMPSYSEGGPRVVVEAMSCGVPVLATPVGIVPDLLKNQPGSNQVAPGGMIIDWDVQDIETKARGLLSDLEEYNKFSNMAIEKSKPFEKKLAIKNYADKLKTFI